MNTSSASWMFGATFLLLSAVPVHAGLITAASGTFTGQANANDCSGFFGQGFENCEINGSSVIAKFEYEDGDFTGSELNTSLFGSIDGSEFSIDFDAGEDGTGNWSYTPGTDDPSVLYWTAKGGNSGFNLFYVVDDALNGTCAADPLSVTCLDAAIAQTTGFFTTPTGQALSHISFYNGGGSVSVPEPASAALVGFGLLALRLVRRRATA